jgi:hypothetical protein
MPPQNEETLARLRCVRGRLAVRPRIGKSIARQDQIGNAEALPFAEYPEVSTAKLKSTHEKSREAKPSRLPHETGAPRLAACLFLLGGRIDLRRSRFDRLERFLGQIRVQFAELGRLGDEILIARLGEFSL